MPRWMEPVMPHLQLEASSAAEAAAPEPALTGASGAEPPAGQSRPGPGPDDARWARFRASRIATCSLQRSPGTLTTAMSATGDTSGLADAHRPVLTSLRIGKSCRQALNGNHERFRQERADPPRPAQ